MIISQGAGRFLEGLCDALLDVGALGGGLVVVVDVLGDEGGLLGAQVVGEAGGELPDGVLDGGADGGAALLAPAPVDDEFFGF